MTNQTIIKPYHLNLPAFVYLRQSSPGQVRNNREGRERQIAMLGHVATLGWTKENIILLDGDTGRSGSTLHGRSDFQTLVEAIATGKAGLVAARELSRLIRDNQDWSQLVRLCRFNNVLLADEHRLYDPANPQDRMVLGIQGAFNEFELSMILERMQLSLQQKARRGEQYDALPPGYICRTGTLCEKHPDQRVQRAIEKVLWDFERFPSANQLYLHLRAEGFQLPVVAHGSDWRDVQWVEPSYSRILRLVRHPAYAGIYVRGRSKVIVMLDEQGHKQTKSQRVSREQWDVFLCDHHAAYISKEIWERNMEKIAAGANVRGEMTRGAVGRGVSLMAGLLRCRRCGHRLQARYPGQGVRYYCAAGERQRAQGKSSCLNFHGADLELALAGEILEVVGPAGVAAAQRAAKQLDTEHQKQRQIYTDRVAAMCEAEARAAREYKQTDITYTAVRQILAAEWEASIARVNEVESRLSAFDQRQPVQPTASQLEQLNRLGVDVERLWQDSCTSTCNILKQQLTRVLIKEIVVDIDDMKDEVTLIIHWSGGHHTELRGMRSPRSNKVTASDLQAVMRSLRKLHPDRAIATVLNRTGIQTAEDQTWTETGVQCYRHRFSIEAYDAKLREASGWLTQSEAATKLGISPMSVHRLVRARVLPAEQPHRGLPMVILASDLDLSPVQTAVKCLQAGQSRPLPEDPAQLKLF